MSGTISQDSPDPEFNNFELKTNSFAVNQVWSLYDSTDGMPRIYARINKVLDSEFKLHITWIDPSLRNSIPISCGIFHGGDSQEIDDHLMFSSQMLHLVHDNNFLIYPRKGEIWAVFRGWSINSENHKQPYEYDYVEILSDFKYGYGIRVAYLVKVSGFVSLFRRDGVHKLQIPLSEMFRFSHKVPSFKMIGKEKEGVPPGCFELDTAALSLDDSKLDVTTSSPKRLQKVHDINNNEATSRSGSANNGEKMTTQKTPDKVLIIDSSPGELHKPTGNTKKRKRNDESLSQFNGAIKSSDLESHVPSSITSKFESQRSWDKFKIDQIWAIYSTDKGLPRKYAKIKRIDTSPEFKLHVAPLILHHPPNLMTKLVCCDCFKLKTGIAEVLVPSNFSHQVKAVKTNIDIPKTEMCRFSHQIPSIRHERLAILFGESVCWELDPKALPSL